MEPPPAAPHLTPSAWVLSAVSTWPSEPTPRRVVVVPWTIRSPFVVVGSDNPPAETPGASCTHALPVLWNSVPPLVSVSR